MKAEHVLLTALVLASLGCLSVRGVRQSFEGNASGTSTEKEAIATGHYWQGHVGLLVPVLGNTSLVVEARRDTSKAGDGFVLDGSVIMLAFRTGAGR